MEKHFLYSKITSVYEHVFSKMLREGNIRAGREFLDLGIKKILEIGVGAGISFDKYPPGVEVTAIDLNQKMLDRAAKKLGERQDIHIELRKMDALHLDFEDSVFEAVFLPSVVTVVPKPKEVIQEAIRVLKPGGHLLVVAHLMERSKMPAKIIKFGDPMMMKFFGFTLALSEEVFSAQEHLDSLKVEPINFVAGYPLSCFIHARKKIEI
jgi:phosphatidylethanolamine/phosphatidyl-N-methylethanolamine N-methyltransferase